MNNNQSKSDLSHQLFRPKRLYITSEDVSDFDDAGSCRFILKEPIIPAEGFKLVYGLSSFGYAATAYNISSVQKNNMLCFKITYLTPAYKINPDGSYVSQIREEKICFQKIVVPDGYYGTLDELFTVLNSIQVTQIKSGIKVDVRKGSVTDSSKLSSIPTDNLDTSNDVPFLIVWSTTVYGFNIQIALRDEPEIFNDYPRTTLTGTVHTQAYVMNNIPTILSIVPGDEDCQNLYKILFTNENDKPNQQLNIRTDLAITGPNPPPSIDFYLNCPLQYDAYLENPPDYINPNEDFQYFSMAGSQDKATLAKQFVDDPYDGTHSSENSIATNNIFLINSNVPFKSYYPPRLYPLYVEVSSNLETQNLTVNGYASNLLCRHFPIGADQGALTFFQSWDEPVMHHARSSRHIVDGVKINFSSEKDKWSFFNLTFFLEIVFYEVVEEEELPQFSDEVFQIPTDDAMTTQLQQYSKSFSNPFPIHASRENSGILRLGSSRSSSLKRQR